MASKATLQKRVDDMIASNKVMVFSKTTCPFCRKAKNALNDLKVEYTVVELDTRDDGDSIQDILKVMTKAKTVPRVFINGKCIGGGDETVALIKSGKLAQMIGQ